MQPIDVAVMAVLSAGIVVFVAVPLLFIGMAYNLYKIRQNTSKSD